MMVRAGGLVVVLNLVNASKVGVVILPPLILFVSFGTMDQMNFPKSSNQLNSLLLTDAAHEYVDFDYRRGVFYIP